MREPAAQAFVDPVKVRDYLLALDHPTGQEKARYFHALGFMQSHWMVLQRALMLQAETGMVVEGPVTLYGRKFKIWGNIQGPNGRTAQLVTVWIILNGDVRLGSSPRIREGEYDRFHS